MKPTTVRIGWVVLLVLIASSSEAGLFKRGPGKYKAPTAASPLTRGRMRRTRPTGPPTSQRGTSASSGATSGSRACA